MPLLRIRTEIEDGPGRLAVLTAALARRGVNILDLSVQVGTEGVVDEFVVDVPGAGPGAGPGAEADHRGLLEALAAAGGSHTAVVPARPHELVDEPTRVLTLVARLRDDPDALPCALAELLRAADASWTAPGSAEADAGRADVLHVPAGNGRAVRVARPGLPFTATEAARADALVRAVLPPRDPRPSRCRVALRDGTHVTVRPIGAGDADAVREMHLRCSRDTRRMRYFSPKPYLPPRTVDLLCAPDRGLTLVAEGPDGSILAMAHLIHLLDPGVAEVAFLVEDAWQGRGLGRALAELLVVLARERGLVELRATALSENVRIRRLFTALGGRTRRTEDTAVVEIRLRLDGRPALSAASAASAASGASAVSGASAAVGAGGREHPAGGGRMAG